MEVRFKQIFRYFVAFFIKDEKAYQASFRFSVLSFAFETLITFYTFYLISSKVRFRGVISFDNTLVVLVILFFFFRVFILHVLLGMILRLAEVTFAVRRQKLFYGLVLIYAYLFLAVKYPQNYDEFSLISSGLKWARLFEHPEIIFLPAVGLLGFLWFSFLRGQTKTRFRWLAAAVSSLGLGYFLFGLQELHPSWKEPQTSRAVQAETQLKEKPNIIFITIDSMRGDVPLEELPELSADFKQYLGASLRFDRVISPLAQTHGALASIFTGNNPTTTGVRTNLSPTGLQSDRLLAGSLLEQLKEQGYELRFIQDTEEYANFNEGNILDHVQAPNFSVANVVISTFFKNRVVYGLFNNPLGYLFLPELKNNTSFFYSYDLPRYTTEVLKELQLVQEKKKPVFLFVHTCSLHWPAILPYPYYPQGDYPAETQAPFSYTSKFRGLSYQKLSQRAWKEQADFNAKIYRSAIKMTTTEFLNPVFTQIRQLGLDKNSIVVLLSDHGEDLWDKNTRYPKEKFVQHGSSLIFGASSELAFLRMHLPGAEPQRFSETVGVIDILPTVMDFAGISEKEAEGRSLKKQIQLGKKEERFYYTETGLWPLSMFWGQFVTTPAASLGPLFRLNAENMALYVDPKFLPGIIQQKQRAVYYNSYRLTLYPTNYGYQEFLCDRKEDFNCEKNLLLTKPEITAKMRVFMQEHVEKDIQSGLLKIGVCSPLVTDYKEPTEMENIGEFQWQYYFQALECLRSSNDYSYATAVFEKLLASEETTRSLKTKIKRTLLELCGQAGAFNVSNLPSYIQQKITVEIEEQDSISFPYATRECLLTLGKTDIAKKMEDKFQLKVADLTSNQSETYDEEEPDDGSRKEFKILLKKYVTANASEKAGIYQHLQDHPKADYYSSELDIARIYENAEGDAEKLQSSLDEYFAPELNYQLVDYLEKYYFASSKNAFHKNSDEGLLHILRQLPGDVPFPLSYFNYMLFKIDEVTKADGLPDASNLRFKVWNPEPLKNGVFNLRRLEVSLALVKGREYLCKKMETKMCFEAKNIVTKAGAQKFIEDFHLLVK